MANNRQRRQVVTPPVYSGPLAQFASPEGFGAAAFMRARSTGLTDAEIKSGVETLRQQGMPIGQRVDIALNPAIYGNPLAQRSEIDNYSMRAVFLPEGSTAGGGKGVVWAAGPGTDQQIYNMFAGKPREDWVLPPSVNSGGEYLPPAGVNYIDRNLSPSEEMKAATAGFDAFGDLSLSPNTSAASPLAGRKFNSIKDAFNAVQESSQRLSKKDIRALSESTGKSKVDVVRALRRERDEAGETGGILTREARENFRAAKETQSGFFGGASTDSEKKRSKAKEAARRAKK